MPALNSWPAWELYNIDSDLTNKPFYWNRLSAVPTLLLAAQAECICGTHDHSSGATGAAVHSINK